MYVCMQRFRFSPIAAIGVYLACQISAIKFAGIYKCARTRDFLCSSLRIASKFNQSGWAILSHVFSKRPSMCPGTRLKCHIAAIGDKNHQVCPHQWVGKLACDFCWRSKSPPGYFIRRSQRFFSPIEAMWHFVNS